MLGMRQFRHALDARCRRNQVHAPWPLNQDILQFTMPGQNVRQVPGGLETEQNIDIGQSQIRVEQQHFLAGSSQLIGQVDRDIGLANAALAAGHRDNLDTTHANRSLAPSMDCSGRGD